MNKTKARETRERATQYRMLLTSYFVLSIASPEKLRRKDAEVSRALQEKQRLIAEILNVPVEDFENIVDIASQPSQDKDAKEVLLAALAQGEFWNELLDLHGMTLTTTFFFSLCCSQNPL